MSSNHGLFLLAVATACGARSGVKTNFGFSIFMFSFRESGWSDSLIWSLMENEYPLDQQSPEHAPESGVSDRRATPAPECSSHPNDYHTYSTLLFGLGRRRTCLDHAIA